MDEFEFSPRPNRASEINWRPWSSDAFIEAEEQDKLVLLSISAVWCHWCHVMDETTYSDEKVIEKINSDFIPVRVNSDRRPDVNRRYNQGGWPSTVFLVPSGAPIAGMTYTPAVGLMAVLDRLSDGYRREKVSVDDEAASQAEIERELFDASEGSGEIDERAVAEVEAWILAAWDKGYGGIGSEPKFPPSAALEFALGRYVETGNHAFKSFVISTLDGMRNGELADRVEGGFFRYAQKRDWSAPHYEKMLSDNSDLIWLYLTTAMVLDRAEYTETARQALDYVLRNLMDDEQRGFYGSQDADEKYYHRDRGGRALLEKPAVDRTIYTDSSAQMVSTLVLAATALSDPGLLSIAERCADFLWRNGFRHAVGACHYFDLPEGKPQLWGQPGDQVNLLRAQLDLYQATAQAGFLERSVDLADVLVENFVGRQGWLAESRAADDERTAALSDSPVNPPDIVVNGSGARALLTLDELESGRGYREAAKGILTSLGERYKQYTYFSAQYSIAIEMFLKGLIEIRISGEVGGRERRDMFDAALRQFNPRKLIRPETVEDFLEVSGEAAIPAAVVCSVGRCVPVSGPDELATAMGELTGSGSSASESEA